MYLISKTRLYLLFTGITVLIVLLTINSYYVFVDLSPEQPLLSKYFAENIVLYAVIALLILAILLWNTAARHKDVLGELDKIVELSRQSPSVLQIQVNKLGLLGKKISEINANLNELNELKSLKISAQAALSEFLLEESSSRLLLTDAEGRILNFSRGLLEYLEVNEKILRGIFIDEFLPDADPSKLINNLRRTKEVTVRSQIMMGRQRLMIGSVWSFYPILNSKSELVYTIGLLKNTPAEKVTEGEQAGISKRTSTEVPDATQQSHIIDRITDYVRTKFERLKSDDNV